MIRLVTIAATLLCIGCRDMSGHDSAQAAREAWTRIESLGGHGVWDNDMVVVSLKNTGISDDDLALFKDLPQVQILDISSNAVTDEALTHLEGLNSLESLIVVDTRITNAALAAYRKAHPNVEVHSEPVPPNTINPFTGKPFGE
ncbi:MAG: hypothetical protein R3C10_05805 [Pirellulales bacterium]